MFLNTAIAACLLFYCICTVRNITTINHTPVLDSKALFWCRCYCSYLFIPPVFHYLFAELVHLLGVLGTQETSCFVVAGLHERDIFDLFLPEFDKPWVIHLRETCCCSTNLCSWRPNTVYRKRRGRRHQLHPSFFASRGDIHGEVRTIFFCGHSCSTIGDGKRWCG